MSIKRLIILFYILTALGMFMPWFSFNEPIVYTQEVNYFFSPLTVWIIISGILLFSSGNSKGKVIATFTFLSLVPLTCIYLFLTWHMLLISGEANIVDSLVSNHYGFFVTFISSLINVIIYCINMLKSDDEN
ncbi:MAG: hypothetical protein RSA01_01510 [Clostridium sp.]|uniref:hypothetical protein n=1 Tax=Clostridium sp. TaxID=1506 RepID=UPI002FCB1293